MYFTAFLISLIVALALTAVFALAFGRRGPWASLFTFFIVVFLASWAGGIWMIPFSPVAGQISWVPFMIVGLVTSLVLAAAVPSWRRRPEGVVATERRAPPVAAMSPYFWTAVIVLVITIIVR